jgi:hypothetical protein
VPTEPRPVSLADVVRRAVEICDPEDTDADLGDLLVRFEDADEPVRSIGNLEERLADAEGDVDPELRNPAVSMAIATVLYLAHRRDEMDDDPDDILRLAARAEWKGHPPRVVADWLAERGIEV